jgi:hypothetical protein
MTNIDDQFAKHTRELLLRAKKKASGNPERPCGSEALSRIVRTLRGAPDYPYDLSCLPARATTGMTIPALPEYLCSLTAETGGSQPHPAVLRANVCLLLPRFAATSLAIARVSCFTSPAHLIGFATSTGLRTFLIGTEGTLELPTYGNYGGGGYSSGVFGGEVLTRASGKPLSRARLTELGSDPVDRLDYLFYRHDVVSNDVGEPNTRGQAKADVSLVKSLIKLDASYDPEASIYAGAATFAYLSRLILKDRTLA